MGPGNLAFLEHGSPFRFLRRWETSFSHNNEKAAYFHIFSVETSSGGAGTRGCHSAGQSISRGAVVSRPALFATEAPAPGSSPARRLPALSAVCGGSHGLFTRPLASTLQRKKIPFCRQLNIPSQKKRRGGMMGFLRTSMKIRPPPNILLKMQKRWIQPVNVNPASHPPCKRCYITSLPCCLYLGLIPSGCGRIGNMQL